MCHLYGNHPQRAKLFTSPKRRKAYLGYDPVPDCPAYGFDYRERKGFRRDVLVYLSSILGSIGFLLASSSYRSFFSGTLPSDVPRAIRDVSAPYHDVSW